MKPNKVKTLIMGLSLVVMLLVGVGSTVADAQGRRGGHRPHRVIIYRTYNPFWYRHYNPFFYPGYYRTVDPVAYQREQGYREGKDEGKDDAKKDRPANPTGNKHYVKSDSIHFREAFVQGYNEGYREKIAEMREKHGD
ncbi:MAG TPA: hypothetical protein VID27_03475 [Blastocatellia bacterium]